MRSPVRIRVAAPKGTPCGCLFWCCYCRFRAGSASDSQADSGSHSLLYRVKLACKRRALGIFATRIPGLAPLVGAFFGAATLASGRALRAIAEQIPVRIPCSTVSNYVLFPIQKLFDDFLFFGIFTFIFHIIFSGSLNEQIKLSPKGIDICEKECYNY